MISTGAATCSACGASLGENDQYCPTCGTSAAAQVAESTKVYEADDAFDATSDDDIDVESLPDWLRDMAPQSGRSSVTIDEPSPPATAPSPDDLPDWLRESGPQPAQDHSPPAFAADPEPIQPQSPANQGVDHQPAEQFSLVSEEDLPEWLRALGEEDASDSAGQDSAAGPGGGDSRAVAMIYEVPQISRAWMIDARTPDPEAVDEARREFASLNPVTSEDDDDYYDRLESVGYAEEETSEFEAPDTQSPAREEPAGWLDRLVASSAVKLTLFAVLLVILVVLVIYFVQGM